MLLRVVSGVTRIYAAASRSDACSSSNCSCRSRCSGSGKTKVTRGEQENPSFSPDGKRIAYSGEGETGIDDQEIYTIKAGGGGKSQVTNTKYHSSEPSLGKPSVAAPPDEASGL